MVARAACWLWTLVAGGGGLWLLATRGPFRLTNGWFALASALAACPLTAPLLARWLRVEVSATALIIVALLFFIAGKLAVGAGW